MFVISSHLNNWAGWCGSNALYSYLRGVWFESRPGHQPSWQSFSMVFLSLLGYFIVISNTVLSIILCVHSLQVSVNTIDVQNGGYLYSFLFYDMFWRPSSRKYLYTHTQNFFLLFSPTLVNVYILGEGLLCYWMPVLLLQLALQPLVGFGLTDTCPPGISSESNPYFYNSRVIYCDLCSSWTDASTSPMNLLN
jgi:hypothetical protein